MTEVQEKSVGEPEQMGIEETFDIEIDNDEAEKIVTVGDAVEQIKNAIND